MKCKFYMGTADALMLQRCLVCVQEGIFRHKIKNGTEVFE